MIKKKRRQIHYLVQKTTRMHPFVKTGKKAKVFETLKFFHTQNFKIKPHRTEDIVFYFKGHVLLMPLIFSFTIE